MTKISNPEIWLPKREQKLAQSCLNSWSENHNSIHHSSLNQSDLASSSFTTNIHQPEPVWSGFIQFYYNHTSLQPEPVWSGFIQLYCSLHQPFTTWFSLLLKGKQMETASWALLMAVEYKILKNSKYSLNLWGCLLKFMLENCGRTTSVLQFCGLQSVTSWRRLECVAKVSTMSQVILFLLFISKEWAKIATP